MQVNPHKMYNKFQKIKTKKVSGYNVKCIQTVGLRDC